MNMKYFIEVVKRIDCNLILCDFGDVLLNVICANGFFQIQK